MYRFTCWMSLAGVYNHYCFLFFELTHRQFLGFRATIIASKVMTWCVIWQHESAQCSLSRSFIFHAKKIAFVIEHDLSWQLTSRTMSSSSRGNQLYQRPPRCKFERFTDIDKLTLPASPQSPLTGMNHFLSSTDHLPPRPYELQAPRQQTKQCQGSRAEV